MQHVGVYMRRDGGSEFFLVEWHLFVIRQLRSRMTKRLRGWKRISSELIARTFSVIETTYLSTYVPYLLRLQIVAPAISEIMRWERFPIVSLSESLAYRCFRRFRIDLSVTKKLIFRQIKLRDNCI